MMLLNRPRNLHLALAAAALSVFIFSVYWFAPISPEDITPYLPFNHDETATTAAPPKVRKVEVEGLRLGEPFTDLDTSDITSDNLLEQLNDHLLEQLSEQLLKRFEAKEVNITHPTCPLDLERYNTVLIPQLKSEPSHSTKRHVTIALNLYNSEAILPSLSLALLQTIFYLKKYEYKIFISIFENDSKDKTLPLLGDLGAALLALNIDGLTFRHSILSKVDGIERIRGLAYLRNEALFPLFEDAGEGITLFINDIVACGSDILELVNQLRFQDAHIAMSTDWFTWGDPTNPECRFRDIWVARGINGEMPYVMASPGGFSEQAPTGSWTADLWLTQDEEIHNRWLEGLPIPVYSGWNGAIAMDSKIFSKFHARFRASGIAKWSGGDISGALGPWGELVATPGYLESDCSASECKLFCRDVWNLYEGRARILVASQSRTGYTLDEWTVIENRIPITHITGPPEPSELIDWSNITIPKTAVCIPSLKDNGDGGVDLWGDDNLRRYYDPRVPGRTWDWEE